MPLNEDDTTAAQARIEDVAECAALVDAQVTKALGRVLAQRRSVQTAFGYVTALSPGTRANCWMLAEAAGHEGWGRMQALLGSYRWDWKGLNCVTTVFTAYVTASGQAWADFDVYMPERWAGDLP